MHLARTGTSKNRLRVPTATLLGRSNACGTRLNFLVGLVAVALFSYSAEASGTASTLSLYQGEVIPFRLSPPPGTSSVAGQFLSQSLAFFKETTEPQSQYMALLGADLAQSVGKHPLSATFRGEEGRLHQLEYVIEILPTLFTTQQLTLPTDKADPNREDLVRIEKERMQFQAVFSKGTSEILWQPPFLAPVEGVVSKTFGKKRVINGTERKPHTGEDIAASLGTPVMASNHGRVVLAGDFFFNGQSVVIDHGGDLFTMYFHLSEVKTREGMFVKRGEVVGLVGQSGRATGPHLHWGARLSGARVDPFSLIHATE